MTAPIDTFEDRLLAALLERFDDLTEPSASRAGPVPVPHRMRRYGLPLGAVTVAATAAIFFLELGGSTAPPPRSHTLGVNVLAAWKAQPTDADNSQVTAAENSCSASFERSGGDQSDLAGKSGPPLAGGQWQPVLVDTRGDLTLALYSNGSDWTACLADPSFVLLSPLGTASQTPMADDSAVLDVMSNRGASGEPLTVAVGRSGSAVTGVGLELTDGSAVTGTVGDGHFIAWWPGDDGVEALSVTTNAGTQTGSVDPSFDRSGPPPGNRTVRLLNPSSSKS